MKYKTLALLGLFITLVFGSGITYSVFHSNVSAIGNQEIAQFIFQTEQTNRLELPLVDLKPGDINNFEFAVSNTKASDTSHVTIEYQIIIETYHFMPLNIELYKLEEDKETLVMKCDETHTRNKNKALVCNSEIQKMDHNEKALDNYIIKVEFPSKYNGEEYSDLADYIDINIKSWQKTN